MGKKEFRLKTAEELKDTTDLRGTVLTTRTADPMFVTEDSQYNDGYLKTFENLNLYKAQQQPVIDQLANATLKAAIGIPLGIVENVGYLGELTAINENDYNNGFTELAREARKKLDGAFPVLRENPNEVFDLKDPAWWITHGGGLVESVGEFLITGAGVGSALSKGAKALTTSLKLRTGAESAFKLGQGLAQLGTASSLAYVESAMSGAQIYKDVLAETGDIEQASKASAKAVRLGTLVTTALNITSVAPMFKSFGQLDDAARLGLGKKSKEQTADWIKRLTLLETQGVAKASIVKKLALEATQEGVEEQVNLFAESEGYLEAGFRMNKGKLEDRKDSRGWLDRFTDVAYTEEGGLNFMLGAVGGMAQTAGMEYVPFKQITNEDGSTSRLSASNLETIQKQKFQKETVAGFKQDIQYLKDNQDKLQAAIENNNSAGVQEARHNLFNVTAFNSMKTETVDELAAELRDIASTDNTQILPNGATEAMNRGLADNIDDNQYRDTAIKKASDIKRLNVEYRDILHIAGDPMTANQIFKKRLAVYSTESTLEDINKSIISQEASLNSFVPNAQHADLAKLKAEVRAYDIAEKHFRDSGETEKADLIASESRIARSLYDDAVKVYPDVDLTTVDKISNQLVSDYSHKVVYNQKLNDNKKEYLNALSNPKSVKDSIDKSVQELTSRANKAKKDKEDLAFEQKRQQDLETARKEKEAAFNAANPKPPIITPDTTEETDTTDTTDWVSLINNATERELDPIMDQLGDNLTPELLDLILKKKETFKTATKTGVDQVETLTTVITDTYKPLTSAEKAELERIAKEELDKQNNLTTNLYGLHNKIAYKAQAQDKSSKTADPFTINEFYKILHSPNFGEGAALELRVLDETTALEVINKLTPGNTYKYVSETWNIPIGIYHKNIFVGFLPVAKTDDKGALITAREYIKLNGNQKSSIIKKTQGNKNTAPKNLVAENYAYTPTFVVGRNTRFELSLDTSFQGAENTRVINTELARAGFVYTVNETPTGDTIMMQTDINKVSPRFVDSFMQVLGLYFKAPHGDVMSTLSPAETSLVKELINKYDQDISTYSGLAWYVDNLFHLTNLNTKTEEGKFNLDVIGRDKKNSDVHYIDLSNNGIRFMKSLGVVDFFRAQDMQDPTRRAMFVKHLSNTYSRVNINRLNKKDKFSIPLLNADSTFEDYTKPTYNEHVALVTSIDIASVSIGENKQTVLVQPSLYIDMNFVNKPDKEKGSIVLENGKKIVSSPAILATGIKSIAKGNKKFSANKDNLDDLSTNLQKKCK